MQKVYSLKPTETQMDSKPQAQPQQPELWFNPRTNRWISKSCRVYREILRDRALVEKGLEPGAKRKSREVLTSLRTSRQKKQQPPSEDVYSSPYEQTYEQTYEPPTEQELALAQRDALFAKFRM